MIPALHQRSQLLRLSGTHSLFPNPMHPVILVINAGSSSVKCVAYDSTATGERLSALWHGEVDGIGDIPRLRTRQSPEGALQERALTTQALDHPKAFQLLFDVLRTEQPSLQPAAAGHRVVHGGERYAAPAHITADVLTELERLVPLAPLHQPHNLTGIRMAQEAFPELPQVACFDTAFHRDQPALAQQFALPRELTESGIRRYGFHGLSYEYIAHALSGLDAHAGRGRVVAAHLGHGASLCAMRDGHSVATTMSFTPLDGLVMGRRCGAIDPGVILYLQRERGMSTAEVEDLLQHRSGLQGVSGIGSDMRTLLASADPHAAEAVELFVYRAALELGAMAAALEGIDALVFTGGIGEHAATVRAAICRRAAWLGVQLDDDANSGHATRINRAGSPVSVWVIPTDEAQMIARHTSRLTSSSKQRRSPP
jgi:acetate kinase